MTAAASTPPPFPTCAFWNMHFLSINKSETWEAKVNNIQQLVRRNKIVAVTESHVDGFKADALFFHRITGVVKCLATDMLILIDAAWAAERGITEASAEVILPGVAQVLQWTEGNTPFAFLHFHLDSANEVPRRTQLATLSTWAREHLPRGAKVIVGGDRNFASNDDERISSIIREEAWRPSHLMNEAWDAFLAAWGGAWEVEQPEYTYIKKGTTAAGVRFHYMAVLDVVCTNVAHDAPWAPRARIGEDLPSPAISDHFVLELRWLMSGRQRNRPRRLPDDNVIKVRRALPSFLFHDDAFLEHLRRSMEPWFAQRPRGLDGLAAFSDAVYEIAHEYLRKHIVVATTPQHQLAVTLALLEHISVRHGPDRVPAPAVDWAQVDRWCLIYPRLADSVILDLNAAAPSIVRVTETTIDFVQRIAHDLIDLLAREAPSYPATEPDTLKRATASSENLLRSLKTMRPRERNTLDMLWDERNNCYTEDPSDWADIITRDAISRQGAPRGDESYGQELLDTWGIDLRGCATNLPDDEVEEILLDGKDGVAPGPDGIPAVVLKRFARQLVALYQEAWHDLGLGAPPSAQLGLRKWTVAPKEPGATRTARLRDIEVCNETRKVIARMVNRVLNRVLADQLSEAQQAFVTGREILVNNVRMHALFQHACTSDTTIPLILLLLDCRKGYNLMSWSWISRCLRAARLPEFLYNLIMAMLQTEARLVLQGVEQRGCRFLAGLAQGCPLSCLVYVICVDPLLKYLSQQRDVEGVSGFVDDWSVACRGIDAVNRILGIVESFERASGQRINYDKSKLVPSRRLSAAEIAACQARWPDLLVSYRERLLGLYLGLDASMADQFAQPLRKFEQALADYERRRSDMSLCSRVIVANVFLLSMFAFPCRHFYMPQDVITRVEGALLRFFARIPFARLGFFAHLTSLYGIRVQLRDLRLSNVAMLLSSYKSNASAMETVREHLQLGADVSNTLHPAGSWYQARAFFCRTTASTPEAVLAHKAGDRPDPDDPPLYRWWYDALLDAEAPAWRAYLGRRLLAHGWDSERCIAGVRTLPRSVPQGHRWELMRFHLNGLCTQARLVSAHRLPIAGPCHLCGGHVDSAAHLLDCTITRQAEARLRAAARMPAAQWSVSDMFFQADRDGAEKAFGVALFAAVWFVRDRAWRYTGHVAPDAFIETVVRALQCPWVTCHLPTRTRADRRAARLRPPRDSEHAVLYRNDGARPKSSRAGPAASWAAAFWEVGVSRTGPPGGSNNGALDAEHTSNMAEYVGLQRSMERALRMAHIDKRVVFELDSQIIARQVVIFSRWKAACRSHNLRPHFRTCVALGHALTERGVHWTMYHIYREYNVVADALANDALMFPHQCGPRGNW